MTGACYLLTPEGSGDLILVLTGITLLFVGIGLAVHLLRIQVQGQGSERVAQSGIQSSLTALGIWLIIAVGVWIVAKTGLFSADCSFGLCNVGDPVKAVRLLVFFLFGVALLLAVVGILISNFTKGAEEGARQTFSVGSQFVVVLIVIAVILGIFGVLAGRPPISGWLQNLYKSICQGTITGWIDTFIPLL